MSTTFAPMIQKQASSTIPTKYGQWLLTAYAEDSNTYSPHLTFVHKPLELDNSSGVLVRIHSECITGDIFGSNRCDCGAQLDQAMNQISKEGGILIYLRQEGRGIGIIEKLKAYNLQDQGVDTFKANELLGHQADSRSYELAIKILKELGISKIRLLTNNPEKLKAFDKSAIQVIRRQSIIIEPNEDNKEYLESKEQIMGHLLSEK